MSAYFLVKSVRKRGTFSVFSTWVLFSRYPGFLFTVTHIRSTQREVCVTIKNPDLIPFSTLKIPYGSYSYFFLLLQRTLRRHPSLNAVFVHLESFLRRESTLKWKRESHAYPC